MLIAVVVQHDLWAIKRNWEMRAFVCIEFEAYAIAVVLVVSINRCYCVLEWRLVAAAGKPVYRSTNNWDEMRKQRLFCTNQCYYHCLKVKKGICHIRRKYEASGKTHSRKQTRKGEYRTKWGDWGCWGYSDISWCVKGRRDIKSFETWHRRWERPASLQPNGNTRARSTVG